MRFPPANLQLRRAQLVLMLATLLPTVMMTAVGIVLLALGGSVTALISGVLVLTFCTTVITGYILGSIFVTKGASLARVQNDFVSSVSHELRTPVTSIRLLIESLKGNRLDDADRENVLSLLGRETARLEQLVNRVLELSRLRSSYHFARDTISVADLIEESIAAFDALTLSRPVEIARRIEPKLVIVGDRETLVSALVNLLTNAWKYAGEGKTITVIAREAGRFHELIVRDNGPGIAKEDQRTIFEQFSRGRAAVDSGAQGVGLGLSFVHAIVKGHHGKLDLTSRPGETEFRIRLKRRREPESLPAPRAQATRPA
jgi:two-component system phosphate regulon sensor histidine kinase PhoR